MASRDSKGVTAKSSSRIDTKSAFFKAPPGIPSEWRDTSEILQKSQMILTDSAGPTDSDRFQQILTDSDMLWYFERGFVIHEFVPNESKWWKWWKATLQLNSCYPLCFPSVLSFSLVLFQPRNIWIICHGGEVLQQGILQSVCRQNQQKKGGRLCSKCSRLGLILYISVLSLQLAQARRFSSISFWISSGAFSQSSSYSSNGSMDESGKRVTGSNQSGCSSSNIACHATISYNFPMP